MDIFFGLMAGIGGTLITQEIYRMAMRVRRTTQEDRRKVELNAELGGFLKRINAVQGVFRKEFVSQLADLERDIINSRPKTLEELDARVSATELPDSLLDILVVSRNRTSTENVVTSSGLYPKW